MNINAFQHRGNGSKKGRRKFGQKKKGNLKEWSSLIGIKKER